MDEAKFCNYCNGRVYNTYGLNELMCQNRVNTGNCEGLKPTHNSHQLKIHPEYFKEVLLGHKTFEIRLNDRNFQVGDTLILQEYNPITQTYTGRQLARVVTYILHGPAFGLQPDYVIMSIQ